MREFSSGGPDRTEEVGEELVEIYGRDRIFCLFGPLAAGKTTLVKGIARGLGVTATIVSPSYVLLRQYEGDSPLFHLDLFRIQSSEEFVEAGLEEYLLQSRGTVAIEWADRIADILPQDRVDVELELIGEEDRRIKVQSAT